MTPAGGSALVAGLAIGDEEAMSPGLVDDMRGSGLAHLTAVSGGNVAIVVGAVIALAWLLRLPLLVRVLLALGSLGFYVVLVHPQPSVLRAGVMGGVVVVSLLIGGRRPGPAVLATAILVVNNVRDYVTDVKVGKRTLVVRFGRRFGLCEYGALLVMSYGVPVYLWCSGLTSVWVLLPLLTLPMGFWLMKGLVQKSGPDLNPVLVSTAKLVLFFGILFAVGIGVPA